MADEPIDREGMGVLRRSAEWASKFGGGRTTNFARRKHAGDIVQYGEALADEREAAYLQDVVQNKTVQDHYFRTRELEAKERLLPQKLEYERELHDMRIRREEQQILTSRARERQIQAELDLKSKEQLRASEDTVGFTSHMSELLDRSGPGTDDYKIGILRGIEAFPHANKEKVNQYANRALEGDEELADVLSRIPPGFRASQLRRGVNGRWGFAADTPEDARLKDRDYWQKERDAQVKSIKASSGTTRTEAQKRAEEAQQQLDRLNTQNPQQQTAPAPTNAPAMPPDRLALARQALEDPSASEAHKAAARRILGQ